MTGFGFNAPTSTSFGIGMNTQTTASPFGIIIYHYYRYII